MTSPARHPDELQALRGDLAYHQMRVLILIAAVAGAQGSNRKLDGLTKLAKLDFLVRYPAVAPTVIADLDQRDPRLHLSEPGGHEVEAPMIRYRYGPWDDRYYPVIGALVGRGLVRYAPGRRGSVALSPTPTGRKLVEDLIQSNEWKVLGERCQAIAQHAGGLTGARLKGLIYERLPELMDRPHRQVIE